MNNKQESAMAGLAGTFGIAVQNFTAYPQMPDVKALRPASYRQLQALETKRRHGSFNASAAG